MTAADPPRGLQEWVAAFDAAPARDVYAMTMFDLESERWHAAIAALRDDVGLARLEFLTAVDEADGSLSVIAQLLGRTGATATSGVGERVVSVFVRTRVEQGQVLASITDLFAGAAWHEREADEMFGLALSTGPGKRLLLGEHMPEHPMLKSFWLEPRQDRPWPGAKEPGESDADATVAREVESETEGRRKRRRRQTTFGIRPSDGEEAR